MKLLQGRKRRKYEEHFITIATILSRCNSEKKNSIGQDKPSLKTKRKIFFKLFHGF